MLLIAGGAAVAAALGGLLLDDGVEDVEKAVQTGNLPGLNLAAAPVDENTKLALKVAVALFALVGVSIGERKQQRLQTSPHSALHTRLCFCTVSNFLICGGLPVQGAPSLRTGDASLQAHEQLQAQQMSYWQVVIKDVYAHQFPSWTIIPASFLEWSCSRMPHAGPRKGA